MSNPNPAAQYPNSLSSYPNFTPDAAATEGFWQIRLSLRLLCPANRMQTQPNHITVSQIAEEVAKQTGQKMSSRKINKMLRDKGYQTKPYGEWQPTEKSNKYSYFNTKCKCLMWDLEVVPLLIYKTEVQTRLF